MLEPLPPELPVPLAPLEPEAAEPDALLFGLFEPPAETNLLAEDVSPPLLASAPLGPPLAALEPSSPFELDLFLD